MIFVPEALTQPNLPIWELENDYSWEVAAALRRPCGVLGRETLPIEQYAAACHQISPWQNRPMAAQQRVRTLLIMTRNSEAHEEWNEAIAYVDNALGVAAESVLGSDTGELLQYRAKLERANLHFGAAANDTEASLSEHIARVNGDERRVPPQIRISLLAQLSACKLFMDQLDQAEWLVRQAQPLIADTPESGFRFGCPRLDQSSHRMVAGAAGCCMGKCSDRLPNLRTLCNRRLL